ncbi:MAG: hypothetical protein AMJ53_06915 [Gammaproteobacteria bacterium SG8_11]|nr:MAG: hypothetical protein AMJ53_06915 [Gammaproteobacteria bacterium SG8_11]
MTLFKKLRTDALFRRSAITLALAGALFSTSVIAGASEDDDGDKVKLTFIHTGDFHGDILPHPNAREDANGKLEGGIARLATVVKKIRKSQKNTIHVHTGDTTSGGPEVLFTQGEAMVKLLDQFGVDVGVPGNWEFSYGIKRYLEFFSPNGGDDDFLEGDAIPSFGKPFTTERRWGYVSANAYFNGDGTEAGTISGPVGQLLTKPYRIMEEAGVRMGFIGCTTNRGPQVVSSNITKGISFTNCNGDVKYPQNKAINWDKADANTVKANRGEETNPDVPPQQRGDKGFKTVSELKKYIAVLRTSKGADVEGYFDAKTGEPLKGEGVDLVIVLSEAGIAENLWNAERICGMDIIFSSDMHEETNYPVVANNPCGGKTIITEQPEDAAKVGELTIKVKDGKITKWKWKGHDVDERVKEDREMAKLVKEVVKPFNRKRGGTFQAGAFTNPYNGAPLNVAMDDVIGTTEIVLERNRFSHEWEPAALKMPGVIEGTGHDLIVDAFREMLNADVGAIRGFRYTITVLPGPITYRDLYHYLSIGAMVAVGEIPSTPENDTKKVTNPDGSTTIVGCLPATDPNYKDHTKNPCHRMAFPVNLRQEIELSGNSTMNKNVPGWGGGWVWNYSGIKLDFNPYGPNFDFFGTTYNTRVTGDCLTNPSNQCVKSLQDVQKVSYASYYYDLDYNRINRNQLVTAGNCGGELSRDCVGDKIKIMAKNADDELILVNPKEFADGKGTTVFQVDAVELVARYIAGNAIPVKDLNGNTLYVAHGLKGTVKEAEFRKTFPRINLTSALPDQVIEFGFPIIEPLRGALVPFSTPPNAPEGWQGVDTPSRKGCITCDK